MEHGNVCAIHELSTFRQKVPSATGSGIKKLEDFTTSNNLQQSDTAIVKDELNDVAILKQLQESGAVSSKIYEQFDNTTCRLSQQSGTGSKDVILHNLHVPTQYNLKQEPVQSNELEKEMFTRSTEENVGNSQIITKVDSVQVDILSCKQNNTIAEKSESDLTDSNHLLPQLSSDSKVIEIDCGLREVKQGWKDSKQLQKLEKPDLSGDGRLDVLNEAVSINTPNGDDKRGRRTKMKRNARIVQIFAETKSSESCHRYGTRYKGKETSSNSKSIHTKPTVKGRTSKRVKEKKIVVQSDSDEVSSEKFEDQPSVVAEGPNFEDHHVSSNCKKRRRNLKKSREENVVTIELGVESDKMSEDQLSAADGSLFEDGHDTPKRKKRKRKLKLHKCEVCEKSFSSPCLLKDHENSHTGARPYTCQMCEKSFTGKYLLSCHKKTHDIQRPRKYTCTICGSSYYKKIHLTRHQSRKHSDGDSIVKKSSEIKFYCATCGKGFTEYANLVCHERIHSGERPYSCSECGKKFITSSKLRVHERVHSGLRPYQCNECGKCFKQSSHRKNHMVKHTTDRPFDCVECGRAFKTKYDLQQHFKRHDLQIPVASSINIDEIQSN